MAGAAANPPRSGGVPIWPSCPSRSSGAVTPSRLITVASGVHLGRLLHCHASNRLQHLAFLLHCPSSSSPRELYHSHYWLDWCKRQFLLKRHSILQSLADSVSESCSSYLYFFNGKGFEKGSIDEGKLYYETSRGNSSSKSNQRLWTNILIGLSVMLYGAQILTQGRMTLWGAKQVNALINRGQIWRLLTSSFLHANLGHLMVNCYSLNSVGPSVEELSGPRRFLAVYFTSAVSSSMLSYWFCQSPSVGASGAIFGLVGSFAVFVLRHRSFIGGGKQEIEQIVRVISLNMVIGLLIKGIDNWGHLGGLLGGAAVSWFLGPAWRFEYQTDDGRAVFADRAPVFRFVGRKQRK